MPSNKVDSMGAPTFSLSFVLYMLWEDAGQQRWFPGGATANKYLVITIKCGLGSFLWGSALTYGFHTHPKRTHQSALTSSSIRNECWAWILLLFRSRFSIFFLLSRIPLGSWKPRVPRHPHIHVQYSDLCLSQAFTHAHGLRNGKVDRSRRDAGTKPNNRIFGCLAYIARTGT